MFDQPSTSQLIAEMNRRPDDYDGPMTCPVCHDRREVQPDRNTPPEPCPRCRPDEEPEYSQPPTLCHDAEADIPIGVDDFVTGDYPEDRPF